MSDPATIKQNVEGFHMIPWGTIKTLELNDLKVSGGRNVAKLKNAIVNRGFSFPFYMWHGHRYVIDGAGRTLALQELEAEGYAIPDLPVVTIKADTLEQAKALVLQASSEHGHISIDSLTNFVADIDFNAIIPDINLPAFDLERLLKNPQEEEPETQKTSTATETEKETKELCDECPYLKKGGKNAY